MEQFYEYLGWTIIVLIVLFIVSSFVSRNPKPKIPNDVTEDDFSYLNREREYELKQKYMDYHKDHRNKEH